MSTLSDGFHRLEDALRQTVVPTYVLSAAGAVTLFNPACERLTGRSAATMLGQVCKYHGPLEAPASSLEAALAAPPDLLAGGTMAARRRRLVPLADGRQEWRAVQFLPLTGQSLDTSCVLALIGPLGEEDTDEDRHAQLMAIRRRLHERYGIDRLVGQCPAMQRVLEQIALASQADCPVFLTGEPGAGKAAVARAIHTASSRRDGPFIGLAASALPADEAHQALWGRQDQSASLYELACDGTLYIDELAALPRESQLQLVERLQGRDEASVDRGPRSIVGTTADPTTLVSAETVRADVLEALRVLTIALPPLREREDDVALLAQYFVERHNVAHAKQLSGVSDQAAQLLALYEWPDNVRELEEVITAACERASGPEIQPDDLPPRVQGLTVEAGDAADRPISLDEELRRLEGRLILRALEHARGNKSQAAEWLGISRPRLYRRMQELGLVDDSGGPASDGQS